MATSATDLQQSQKASVPVAWMRQFLGSVLSWFESVGDIILFAIGAGALIRRRPYRIGHLMQIMEFVGVGSLGIVLLTGVFTGAVFAVQTAVAFEIFNVKSLIGGSVTLALVRELAPTLTALMVAGRVGSSITTELGTMRVSEQIDALEAMAVDPVHYLVTPRFIACLLLMPMLTVGFNAVGLLGAYLVGTGMLGIDHAMFFSRIYLWVQPSDIWCSISKGTAFGAVVGAVACYKGYFATGGSRGVGKATTSSVVTSSVTVLVVDYFITTLWMQ